MDKKKNTGVSSKEEFPAKTMVPPVKTSPLQKALNVINSYRENIHKNKKKDYDNANKKGFYNADDEVFFKSLHNMWLLPYTESDILSKNFEYGEGVFVFRDGQKYAVKKEDDRLIIAN